MTERIRNLRKFFIEEHQHRTFRKAPGDPYLLAAAFREQNLPDTERAVKRLVYMLDEETPLLFPEQTILFLRTNPTLQALFTEEEKEALAAAYRTRNVHLGGRLCEREKARTKFCFDVFPIKVADKRIDRSL